MTFSSRFVRSQDALSGDVLSVGARFLGIGIKCGGDEPLRLVLSVAPGVWWWGGLWSLYWGASPCV